MCEFESHSETSESIAAIDGQYQRRKYFHSAAATNPPFIATMKIVKNDEPWRLVYIRLLTTPAEEVEGTQEELAAYRDLMDAGFIKGKIFPLPGGELGGVIEEVTLQGHLFADEQQALVTAGSVWGQMKSGTGLALGWVAGIVSSLVLFYLTGE